MHKMQLQKYKLGISCIEFSGISVNLFYLGDWEINWSLFMQTSCVVFTNMKNGQSFSHL